MKIKIKKAFEDAKLPNRAHMFDAGADLYAYLWGGAATIHPGDLPVMIDVGFSMAIPEGYEGQIRPRSGLACKHGITVANAPATVDSEYRGPVKVALVNLTNTHYTVSHGDRIAQLVIARVELPGFEEADELDETERGSGGFGSTGR